MKKLMMIILCGLQLSVVVAQPGPTVECYNCDGTINKPYPVSGNWYNREQSGSGYIMDIQNGFLSGFYFGYDGQGQQKWLNFQGPLIPGEADSDVLWQLETKFITFSDGNAINQDYQSPTAEETTDEIKIEFIFKHYARVSVNGQAIQNIQPLVYGVPTQQEFTESKLQFPDLTGLWTFVYKRNFPDVITQESLYFSDIYAIWKTVDEIDEDGTKTVVYGIDKIYHYPPYEILVIGDLECSNPLNPDNGKRQVVCILEGFPSWPLGGGVYRDQEMIVPIGDLGAFSFSAEFKEPGFEETGLTLEATRVNFLGMDE